MDRRQQNRTNQSDYLITEQTLKTSKPEIILNRMLSTKFHIIHEAPEDPILRPFRQIGKGQCGTVFSLTGTPTVFKLPNTEEKVQNLYNDFCKHKAVEVAFSRAPQSLTADINIPKLGCWIRPTSHFWESDNIKLFPDDEKIREPTYGLISDHIYPLSGPIRKAIVDAFCPEHLKAQKQDVLAVPINKDCLVRLYLGRRGDGKRTSNGFKLRNFELLVDDMERLQLEVEAYAKIMAQTLAILHWCAKVDGDHVEFILGSAPQSKRLPTFEELVNAGPDGDLHARYEVDFQRRSVGIWLLDFNQCTHFEDNSEGLKVLINSFWFNDPYYPRPGSRHKSDKALWNVFAERYLQVSAEFTTSQTPNRFIDGVVREGEKRAGSGFLFG